MRRLHEVFYVFENIDNGVQDYIFIKNVLRFRRAKIHDSYHAEWSKDKIYLQFVMKDGDRTGFFVTNEEWSKFKGGLPWPPNKIYCHTPPEVRTNYESDDGRMIFVKDDK